ncbi:hypothetical protein A1OK_22030 [Enterovibrio norvegicus FF-454]|uniref:Chain-length determining protein n=1 Tax=Enterovibrio norvegicus FF-454 TaxID=1185651 RepID=A0A1E5C7C2_9GAMM|nr:Wzz/FepE/Etk N-terminal domain-containing protein [Enterovibrio norvegicus]OEE61092.1 hypothetical protein A1OK_22030 [Enterovibrio norvegicus FF-454]
MTSGKQSELQYTRPNSHQEDDIDLRILFKVLLQGKSTIVACTLLFVATAAVYAINAQEWWTTKAVITTPRVADVVTFSQAVKRYQPAFDYNQFNAENNSFSDLVQPGLELDVLINERTIFERFLQAFNASKNKREFLNQSPVFVSALELLDINDDTRAYSLAVNDWLGKLIANRNDKTNNELITLSAQSVTDLSSLTLLNNYIAFINKKVTAGLIDDLRSTLQIKKNELFQQLESRELLVAQQLKLEIAKAERALKIANAAQIRRPVQNLNKEEIFAIDIGADAISEKVNVLKSLDDLSILDPNLGQIRNKLAILQRELPQIENLTLFSYLESAELPLNRDKPKRALIVVLGALLGGMFGIAIVMVRYVFRKD